MHRFLCIVLSLIVTVPLIADDTTPGVPPVPAPAFMDVVSFEFNADGENRKVIVTSAPGLLRVDEPNDRYSFVYNPQTEFFLGLEHSNYTYWDFSWPEVRGAVENSKRYEKRLQDLGNEGMNSDSAAPTTNSASTTAPGTDTTSGLSDAAGYVWRPTMTKKRIGDYDCVQWNGETESGESVQAWCYAGLLPKVQAAVANLRAVEEPMELVPVRTIAPDFIFPVYDALIKGGVTPLLITWGDEQNKDHFRFLAAETVEGKLSLFSVPKLYTKTTLVTMDGMIDSQPAPDLRGSATAPRVDHSNPNPGQNSFPKMGQ